MRESYYIKDLFRSEQVFLIIYIFKNIFHPAMKCFAQRFNLCNFNPLYVLIVQV